MRSPDAVRTIDPPPSALPPPVFFMASEACLIARKQLRVANRQGQSAALFGVEATGLVSGAPEGVDLEELHELVWVCVAEEVDPDHARVGKEVVQSAVLRDGALAD